jgi:hypothetical protein
MPEPLKPSARLAKARAVREALEANPQATLEELRRTAKAGQSLVILVRERWRAERGLIFSQAPA